MLLITLICCTSCNVQTIFVVLMQSADKFAWSVTRKNMVKHITEIHMDLRYHKTSARLYAYVMVHSGEIEQVVVYQTVVWLLSSNGLTITRHNWDKKIPARGFKVSYVLSWWQYPLQPETGNTIARGLLNYQMTCHAYLSHKNLFSPKRIDPMDVAINQNQ